MTARAEQISLPRVLHRTVPPVRCEIVLRMLWLDVREHGLPHDELMEWYTKACPFPHLRFQEEVQAAQVWVQDAVADDYDLGDACEPQFIFQLPDEHRAAAPSHVDEPPPWAGGRQYALIAGLALNAWDEANGTVRVWLEGRAEAEPVVMDAGDVLLLGAETPHATGNNASHLVRAGVYFRWLKP